MTDTATVPATPNKAGAKKAAAKPKKPKVPSSHPKYAEMTVAAISALKERNGSSRQAILKYIIGHYNVGKDPKVVNTHLKLALKRGTSSGSLKHAKGQGASGSFRVNSEKKTASVVVKKVPAAKPKKVEKKVKKSIKVVEKPKKPKAKKATAVEKKKPVAAKPKAKPKAKSPKIKVHTKSPKPKKAKSPKKAAKPKKAKKSPKKAAAKK